MKMNIYCEINGAMYGLKVAGYIANKDLEKHLKPHGYYPSKKTPGLWFHKTRLISFTLVVDDFGVKYMNKKDIDHLFDIVKENPVKIDWTGSKYLGIDIEWHYDKEYVILSMKRYVKKALKEFLHEAPKKPVHGPTKYNRPEYGKKVQYAKNDLEKPLNKKLKSKIQSVC